MTQKYDRLKTLLRELFQLDQPDLDFGLYRIMHAKSAEVSRFLENDLLAQVQDAFNQFRAADRADLEKEITRVSAGVRDAGLDPSQSPKVRELQARLETGFVDAEELEADVYDHLYTFFRRYYSDGDFLTNRVYKANTFAIPYEGEEIKLHWANADQYYVKSSSYLRDYAFRLRPSDPVSPMRVHFRLVEAAEEAHGNAREIAGQERKFRLSPTEPVAIENGEFVARFTYRPDPAKQKDLLVAAEETILAPRDTTLAEWVAALEAPAPTPKDPQRTVLAKHLRRYADANAFDYFIHKDLDGFLRRELDFFIKNEVMRLDDVAEENAPRVEQYLSKVRIIRRVAGKIIAFLAQLEDFQKKLWLKKKFVIGTTWCIRLGCMPRHFYKEIASNVAQRQEWVRLCGIDAIRQDLAGPGYSEPLTEAFLSAYPTLMVDTSHFTQAFTDAVIETLGDVDEMIDGTLFRGDNFQALSFMATAERGRVKTIYIDPPYNTDAGPIDYKNGYRSSSWLTMIADRISLARSLLADDGILCATIDDYQVHELAYLLDQTFGKDAHLGTAVIRNNPSGRSTVRGLSVAHEYAFFYAKAGEGLHRLPRSEQQLERFTREDDAYVDWRNFRKDGGAVTHRSARPKQFYPLYVRADSDAPRVPELAWNPASRSWDVLEEPAADETAVWPIDERGNDRVWSLNHISAVTQSANLQVRRGRDGSFAVFRRHRPSEGVLPRSWWDKNTYAAREYGSAALVDLFGTAPFSFAKSPFAVQDCLWAGGLSSDSDGTVLDFFAGSGTTGHAVINLNRMDGGSRKFILVEQEGYFDTVLLPRLKKVAFTAAWKSGKPVRYATAEEAERTPRVLRVIRLETYEDTLNNLTVSPTDAGRQLPLGLSAEARQSRESYLVKYMLQVETRGSGSLLNVRAFDDPSAYTLRIREPGSDEAVDTTVDLAETFNWLVGLRAFRTIARRGFEATFTRQEDSDLPSGSPRRLALASALREKLTGRWQFHAFCGDLPDGRKALVIWRNRPGGDDPDGVEQDNLVLNEWFTAQGFADPDAHLDVVYVNGGSNLGNLRPAGARWGVRLIEDDFHRLVFETHEG